MNIDHVEYHQPCIDKIIQLLQTVKIKTIKLQFALLVCIYGRYEMESLLQLDTIQNNDVMGTILRVKDK